MDQPASPLLLFCPRLAFFSILKPSPNKVGKVLKLEVKPVTFWAFQGSWAQRGVTKWAAIAGGAKRQKLRGMLAKGLQSWSIPIRFFISLLKYLRKSQWLKKKLCTANRRWWEEKEFKNSGRMRRGAHSLVCLPQYNWWVSSKTFTFCKFCVAADLNFHSLLQLIWTFSFCCRWFKLSVFVAADLNKTIFYFQLERNDWSAEECWSTRFNVFVFISKGCKRCAPPWTHHISFYRRQIFFYKPGSTGLDLIRSSLLLQP